MADKERRAKPTDADRAAAANAKRIWMAIPKSERPTQDAFAEELGITQGAVSQYFGGKIPFNLKAVLAFAKVLRCRPIEIRSDLPQLSLMPDPQAARPVSRVAEPAWPFTFDAARLRRLTTDQLATIEASILGLLERFESAGRPKRPRKGAGKRARLAVNG